MVEDLRSRTQGDRSTLRCVVGDATYPDVSKGPVFIAHVCNDVGAWGAGFTRAVEKRWPGTGDRWRRNLASWKASREALGLVFFDPSPLEKDNIIVVNMVAQHGVGRSQIRLNYPALRSCLTELAEAARGGEHGPSIPVHMPRIGCGLAGGSWDEVEPIIRDTLVAAGVEVVVYDLGSRP